MKQFFLLLFVILFAGLTFAREQVSIEDLDQANSLYQTTDPYTYKDGAVEVKDIGVTLTVPEKYKFLDAQQSKDALIDVWGNDPQSVNDILGMIFKKEENPYTAAWAFVISYENIGYVSDEEVESLDHEQLLKDLQQTNDQYSSIIARAEAPSYDANKKVMYRAKEIAFQGIDETTLNYEVRVLGRKGVLVFTAVGFMTDLDDIKANREDIINIATFKKGYTYQEFDPSVDKAAAYGIAGLVAGAAGVKLLGKAGFLAFIAKFGKVILLALAGFIAIVAKRFKKEKSSKKSKN